MATNINLVDKMPGVITSVASRILSGFEDPVGLERPLWRDVSRWQEKMNYSVSAANGVLGVAARATISWGYQDSWFPWNWSESKAYGLYRTSYHVLYPGESIVRQADNWYQVHPEIDVIPRVIDMELQHEQPYSKIANVMWELSNLVFMRDGVRPIIYTRYSLVNNWLATWTPEMLNMHYWWLAQYLYDRVREHPGPPTLPNRVNLSRVILHQTADKKAPFSGETSAKTIDWDRWEMGNSSYMHQWIAETWGDGTIQPPPTECPCQDEIDLLETRIYVLEQKAHIHDDQNEPVEPPPAPPAEHNATLKAYTDRNGKIHDNIVWRFVGWKQAPNTNPDKPMGVPFLEKMKSGSSIWRLSDGHKVKVNDVNWQVDADLNFHENYAREWLNHEDIGEERYFFDRGNVNI